jgi:hypothetical protein
MSAALDFKQFDEVVQQQVEVRWFGTSVDYMNHSIGPNRAPVEAFSLFQVGWSYWMYLIPLSLVRSFQFICQYARVGTVAELLK